MFEKLAEVMREIYLLDLDCRASEDVKSVINKKGMR